MKKHVNERRRVKGGRGRPLIPLEEPSSAAYGDTGRHYAEDAEFVSRMSEEIASMSEDVNHTVSEVSKAIQVMTGNTQKSNEHTKTISDNMDETTAVLKNVADTAGEQAHLAANLNDMVRKFKV